MRRGRFWSFACYCAAKSRGVSQWRASIRIDIRRASYAFDREIYVIWCESCQRILADVVNLAPASYLATFCTESAGSRVWKYTPKSDIGPVPNAIFISTIIIRQTLPPLNYDPISLIYDPSNTVDVPSIRPVIDKRVSFFRARLYAYARVCEFSVTVCRWSGNCIKYISFRHKFLYFKEVENYVCYGSRI